MLKTIYVVTVLVLSSANSERAYHENLDYQTVERGAISAELADAWQAPGAEGRSYVLMRPDSESEVYLRFVQAPDRGNYEPMKTLGWNAVEIQAQDPDTIATELNSNDFEIIGPPAFLSGGENIRAMQVLGPDRELVYLTHVLDPGQSTFNIGTATSRVDRVFIMVLGTADLAATTAFYGNTLQQEIKGPYPYKVTVLSRAWGAPEETLYDLSIAQLQGPFLIEIDAYPAAAQRRTTTGAALPFGPAIVGFLVADVSHAANESGRTARRLEMAPYNGRQVLFLEGPSGELIELIEE